MESCPVKSCKKIFCLLSKNKSQPLLNLNAKKQKKKKTEKK
jgi:hypothetical protein